MQEKKSRLRPISWWRMSWRAWRVFRLLIWTIWVIYRERQRVIRARSHGNYDVQPDIDVLIEVLVAFRQTALKLGVLMIKLGQFLSARADLLPERALSILISLQDEVPPAPFDHVVYVIESELGKPVEEVFSILERKCTAAASLGQVHKAVLASTGETVAVKVQRPNVEQLVRMDLSTLRFVIWVIMRFVNVSDFIDLVGLYREFKRTVYEEIDYATEAANARRFKEMFKNDATIYIPRVHDKYVSRRVLVLEWIDGIKINDYTALEVAGVDRLEVAKRTVQAYFYQFFDQGFFHADPHPGNIFIKPVSLNDGTMRTGPVIAFVDFGMVGSLTKGMKRSLRDLFLGFVGRNSHTIVNSLVALGFIGEGANLASIEHAMTLMLDQYYGMTLGEARALEIPEVAHDIDKLLYGQPFKIPAQFAFMGRAVGTLVGVATGLAPEFNFVQVATPYARKFLGLDMGRAGQTIEQILTQLLDTSRVLLSLPYSLDQLISKINMGQIEVKIANNPLLERGRSRSRRAGNGNRAASGRDSLGLTGAFIFVAALAAGVFLTNVHQIVPGWFCLGLAGITVLGMLLRR